ncbi:response regulator [Sorangium sp. So ce1078]|uniref:response regulator n=1 Tax=Sorangium sp. So ce1078 TaxID=3133329 RepID=UPI003F6392E6
MPEQSHLVLLVDDEPANLKVLSDALSGQGFSIAVAAGGERALEQAQRRPPDLILLDALMPGMDGFETCRRLKAAPATRDVPLIFITCLNDSVDRVHALELGAVDFVSKPFDRDELLARVRTQLSLRSAMKSLTEKNLELERARAQVAEAAEELRRGKEALDLEVSRRTEELSAAKTALEAELEERRRAEAERLVLQQQILEMSTPIIPISDRILVMPLIGLMDEERAGRVLEAALRRTTESQAEVMILDITGVLRADERVAAAILDTARALRLLGARTVLTGIRPEMAQALVALNVEFADVMTKSTLQAGIAHAMHAITRAPTRQPPKARGEP